MYPLFEQARDGDPCAKNAVVESLRPRISRMATYYARCSGEDPEDLLQEAWMGLLEALPALDVKIGSPEQYLIQRARWHLLDSIKNARARRCVPLEDEDAENLSTNDSDATLDQANVSDFTRHLTKVQRKVLRLLLAGFTWREAGNILGCSSANIAYYVRQIKKSYKSWNSGKPIAKRTRQRSYRTGV